MAALAFVAVIIDWSGLFPQKWQPPTPREKPDPHYFEVELDPGQRIALLDLIRKRLRQGPSAALASFLRKLELEVLTARRVDMPLIRERLPWDLARERGCSEVELFEDLAHTKEPY